MCGYGYSTAVKKDIKDIVFIRDKIRNEEDSIKSYSILKDFCESSSREEQDILWSCMGQDEIYKIDLANNQLKKIGIYAHSTMQ